jgi:hypothetical protein
MRNRKIKISIFVLFGLIAIWAAPAFGNDLSTASPVDTDYAIKNDENAAASDECGKMYLWGREVQNQPYNEKARLARCASERNENQSKSDGDTNIRGRFF